MNKKLQNKLFKEFPKLFKDRKKSFEKSCMARGIEIDGDGWYDILHELCNEIQTFCDLKSDRQVYFDQVKEKFGMLRVSFYVKTTTDLGFSYGYVTGYVSALCVVAERKSATTCEICGKSERSRCSLDSGLIKCVCYEHKKIK